MVERNPAFAIVDEFEKAVAEYTGALYCVAVDSCTNAIFLSLRYRMVNRQIVEDASISHFLRVPKHTYVGVLQAVKNAGFKPYFGTDSQQEIWTGYYLLDEASVCDSAKRFTSGMIRFTPDHFMTCISFQAAKILPIGRGGAILTGDRDAVNWLRRARFDGRDQDAPISNESVRQEGWHMYMTPEQAARGLWLMQYLPEHNEDIGGWQDYPDLSEFEVFK